MLEFLAIDLAGDRPAPERTAAINGALAALEPAKPKRARGTIRTPNSRFLRDLIASFKPPRRDHPADPPPLLARRPGGEVGRAPPALAPV